MNAYASGMLYFEVKIFRVSNFKMLNTVEVYKSATQQCIIELLKFDTKRLAHYFFNAIEIVEAIFSPSIAALIIPPAYPAPSPQGYKFFINDFAAGLFP